MKRDRSLLRIAPLLAIVLCLLAFAGCAWMGAGNKEALLAAAGFRVLKPGTPTQNEFYAAAPPYRLQFAIVNGKVFYVYKDSRRGVAYVGGEPEYQLYQRLAIQQRIARDYYMAAAMNRDAAWGWYGAWGPRALAW